MNDKVFQDKIYPILNPSAPTDDKQIYRLSKINEMEKFLRDEISSRDKLAKQFKRRAITATISDTAVITTITGLEIGSIITIATGVGAPVGIALAASGVALGISSIIAQKLQKLFDSKSKKHEKIKVLAEAKLDSISGLVSKAVEDSTISHQEFQFILTEIEHYRNLKKEIRMKSKRVADAITTEQREAILAQGKKQGKDDFLKQIARSSDTQTANAT